MLSVIATQAPCELESTPIQVEVDIRTGLPGIEIVGLPDNAVREARERVRVAVRNCGYRFPPDRILVNLSPAGIRKEGASYDLPIALGVLIASGQIRGPGRRKLMVLGELNLAGAVLPVRGVLSAVCSGLAHDVAVFLVPEANLQEAQALCHGSMFGIASLRQAVGVLERLGSRESAPVGSSVGAPECSSAGASVPPAAPAARPIPPVPAEGVVVARYGDLADIRGQGPLRRALEIAAAGGHHLLLFGPPGSGKTMAARRLPTILPPLSRQSSLEATRIHSMAGTLPAGGGLLRVPPFRSPHHSASSEGIIGGGKALRPGEVSLAHRGVLFLDEAPEFKSSVLQVLREPLEEGTVTVVRAGGSVQYPAAFQLVLALNPCPCGNLGRPRSACLCSVADVRRYWKRLGGALLDRIDMRVPLVPASTEDMAGAPGESSAAVARRVAAAAERQRLRYTGLGFRENARLPSGVLERFCPLEPGSRSLLARHLEQLSLSSRAYHSIIRVSRTIADLDGEPEIRREHLMEALHYRRYGEGSYFWSFD
jgi:magnesium chelatase family protein